MVERNILPESTAAPALQSHQRELANAMRRDSIEKHLQTRPAPSELVKEGILEGEWPLVLVIVCCFVLTANQRMKTPWLRYEDNEDCGMHR